jgi:predicted porin
MSIRTLLATAAVIALPGVALAQNSPTMSSTITLGYTSGSLDVAAFPGYDVDLTTTSIDVDSDIMFGSNFNVGLDFGIAMTEIDATGGTADVDLLSFSLEPSYHFGNGAYVGFYYRMGDLDVSIPLLPITLGVDTTQSGIFAGYENGPLWMEAFYGTSDTDPGIGGIDVTDMGLAMSYDVMPNLELFGSYTRTDIDTGGFLDIDVTLMAIGADYDFGNGLALYGSVGRLDIGTPFPINLDATQFSLGASYDLAAAGGGFPGVVSLEMTRTSFDLAGLDADVNSFGLAFTIPLGNNASTTPLNSSTQIARGSYRSAIAGGLASLR